MVARGGIEPPTRGFAVAGSATIAARKPKTGLSFFAVGCPGRANGFPVTARSPPQQSRWNRAGGGSRKAVLVTRQAYLKHNFIVFGPRIDIAAVGPDNFAHDKQTETKTIINLVSVLKCRAAI